jgi:enamine deaminase RidA (YjgF/YER057c/UK114 family)
MQQHFYYIKGQGNTFGEQLSEIFTSYIVKGLTVRLVFFGSPQNNREYEENLNEIGHYIQKVFGDKPPVYSYVAQPPVERQQLVMEVFDLDEESEVRVWYKNRNQIPYVIVETPSSRQLYLGGVRSDSGIEGTRLQSESVFARVYDLLTAENMPVSSIVRQWNYIEKITGTSGGHQNYQDFNDSRSRFYSKTSWVNGYPAATGVGTCCGGVMVDLDAFHSAGSGNKIVALNNTWQVPAHAYSGTVLYGEESKLSEPKTTPKFERAKLVLSDNKGIVYISGTAAIRGELSLENVGIEEQTRITIENIEHLISKETLNAAGIWSDTGTQVCALRIYLKDASFYEKSRNIVSRKYNGIPSVYLMADVCRDELLIEIEGIATLGG